MYPIERFLEKLKSFVRNRSQPDIDPSLNVQLLKFGFPRRSLLSHPYIMKLGLKLDS
ncbi:hypothetical protein LINPERHAP1_LOCUS18996, partial [Linum perenne]